MSGFESEFFLFLFFFCFFVFFFYYRIVNGAYVWVCVSVLFPRIEPVGKPYREVCLRSELWHWMAHQPNSWSKHPGTRIEQVLAYCRDEQKYVGWAIILSHCDHDIWRTNLKIHRIDGRDTAYIPAKFHRNSFKNKREISVQHIFQGCLLVTLTFNLRPWNLHQVVSLSRTINQLNLKTMGW